jgi:hypothetical protein
LTQIRPELTILTDPVPYGRHFFVEPAKQMARRIRNLISPRPLYTRSKYRGHFAVTRSMVEGLQKIGVRSNYNPQKLSEVGEVVVVPGGFAALRQAIGWKRSGYIRRLLAGTNLVDFPSERRELICAEEIDLLIVPCDWVRDNFIADCPELQGRVESWPAGVDTTYWSSTPDPENEPRCILVYDKPKRGPVCLVSHYIEHLKRRGYHVKLLKYGHYLPSRYLDILWHTCVMLGFSPDESQGIAWAEAWSVNVPTLLWNQEYVTFKERTFRASTAPYLTPQTGLFFASLAEFEKVFQYWEHNREQFQPRAWVLENMSDEVRARALCELAHVRC